MSKIMKPSDMRKSMVEGIEAADILDDLIKEDLQKAKSDYINPDNTFKGGFKGCMRYQMEEKGLSENSARKLCAYIGRKSGKIH
jgi:hypothetical protein